MASILVAVPFKGRPELLPRAVRSILRQTVREVRVVVYGDGEVPPKLPRDPRLLVYSSPVNRGPYYGLQALLLASPYEYFAPIGADDWIEPDHLERMVPLARRSSACITGRVFWHNGASAPRLAKVTYEVGLFRTDRLLAIGGYNPAERVGQDTLIVRLLMRTGAFTRSRIPTYHRMRYPGSLSTSAETGNDSPYRALVRARNDAVLARCSQLYRSGLRRAVRDYRAGLVPPDVRAALEVDVAALREIL